VPVPRVHASAFIHPSATLVGDVEIGAESSVWLNASLRGDMGRIVVGAGSSVQDGCALHNDPGEETRVGDGVSIGHGAVVHGSTVEDDVVVGMNAVVLGGAIVGAGSLVGAGAVVPGGARIPPDSLVLGVPGKVVKQDPRIREGNRANADRYRALVKRYVAGEFPTWGTTERTGRATKSPEATESHERSGPGARSVRATEERGR